MRASRVRYLLLLAAIGLSACQTPPVTTGAEETPAQVGSDDATAAQCECPVVEQPLPSCPPAPAPRPATTAPCPSPTASSPASGLTQGLLLVGRVEYVMIKREGSSSEPMKLKARIDTGAGLSSMHAHQLVEFERDGAPWVRFGVLKAKSGTPVFFERPVREYVAIKQDVGEPQRRPVVRMSLRLGDLEESVEVTLSDRSEYVYPVLLGRNFLRDRAIVDVRRKFIADNGYYQD